MFQKAGECSSQRRFTDDKIFKRFDIQKRIKKTPQQQIDELNFILSTKGATMTAEERAELEKKRKELKKQV